MEPESDTEREDALSPEEEASFEDFIKNGNREVEGWKLVPRKKESEDSQQT